MQWWMRPGPSLPCAISKPQPSPFSTLSTGTRTFARSISMCPCGASSTLSTESARRTLIPGASAGTSSIDCWRCFGAPGSVLPMTMYSLQRGSPAPDDHHLRPLIT